jgi:Mannosylglycerate hydrolase MGH1-like glycoside hydrolase domain
MCYSSRQLCSMIEGRRVFVLKFCVTCIALALALSSGNAQRIPVPVSLPAAMAGAPAVRSGEYIGAQKRLQKGWNTWDTDTIAGEVLLPEGLEVRLGLKHNTTLNGDSFLPTMLIGRTGPNEAQIKPGPHAYDGSTNSFEVTWADAKMNVEAAHAGDDLVMLVTPLGQPSPGSLPATAIFSVGFLWNRPGQVMKHAGRIVASAPGKSVFVYLAGHDSGDTYTTLQCPYFSVDLSGPVGISTGKPRTVQEIRDVVDRQQQAYSQSHSKDTGTASILEAIETTLAWDTIYEPQGHRVISPVSRVWNVAWGGYVLFDWDTFFAADLAAVGSRDLAYANVLEILNEETPEGFVPNYARAGNWKSFDRSEPPVGAITVLKLYQQYRDRWLLEETFDRLLKWNRWWPARRDMQGYLVWGSDGENQPANLDDHSRGTLQGAKYESGIDNGPPFDAAHYNPTTHKMEFADVGLISLYIADSNALATIADILGKRSDAQLLRQSARKYQTSLATLWDAKTGIFLNKDLHTGKLSYRLSPTNFYPLLAKAATPQQADEMVKKHLLNPDEFWGERVLPAIARNDPAFKDQDYWRGRIWGPMNYLVYEGLLNYETPSAAQARRELADKSMKLFLHEWIGKGHVHENYSATSDDSDGVRNSDPFYHWGALLGLIEYEEQTRSSSIPAKP